MSALTKTIKEAYKAWILVNDYTNGLDSSLERITDGSGNKSSLRLSKDAFEVQPQDNDSTAAFAVKSKSGTSLVDVDSTNSLVKSLGHNNNTQYATFGTAFDGLTANNHYAMGYSGYAQGGGDVSMGTGTDPDTSISFTTTADDFVNRFMYLHDDITIDSVRVFVSDSGSTATGVRFHLMEYDIDTSNGSTSGDVSNGVVIADGSDLTSVNYSAIDTQAMTIQSADVDAGKVIVATALFTNTTDKKSVNIQLKYHLR